MATTSVDFDDLRQRISFEQIVQALGLVTTKKNNQLRTARTICNTKNKRSMVITPSKGVFYCFDCKAAGTAFDLAAAVKGISLRDAGIWIAEQCGASAPHTPPNTSTRECPGFDAAKYATSLDPDHPSLEPLGIDPKVLRGWQAGWAKSGKLRGCLALPATQNGQIVAFFGRNDDGHLTFINGFVPHDYIFGENKVEEGDLQLIRDPLDVIKAREAGVNAVCFLVDELTPQMLEQLAGLMDRKKRDALEIF